MFKFTTTTFINSANYLDSTTEKRFEWKQDAFRVNHNDIRIKAAWEDAEGNKIYKRVSDAGACDKVVFTLPGGTKSDLYRICLYVHPSMVDQNSYYSNDLVFKGKPFYVEYTGDMDGEAIADLIKKYEVLTIEKDVFTVTGDTTSVTLEAKDNTLRITKAILEKYEESAISTTPGTMGEFVETAEGTITKGHEEFGTYHQLTKDLHLPTYENRRWAVNQEDETPLPGATYTQYLVRECVNRGIMGGDAVGEVTKSLTTHVFWVREDSSLISEFEGVITKLGDLKVVPEANTTADTADADTSADTTTADTTTGTGE